MNSDKEKMPAHQMRVVDEKTELDCKLAKLNAFIASEMFSTIDYTEQVLLRHQASIMHDYSFVLSERIEVFNRAKNDNKTR